MKRLLLFAMALLMVFLLTSCTRYMWKKDGATMEDFRKDSYECERDMRQSGYYGGSAYEARAFGERCMKAKGYRKVPADETARSLDE